MLIVPDQRELKYNVFIYATIPLVKNIQSQFRNYSWRHKTVNQIAFVQKCSWKKKKNFIYPSINYIVNYLY